MSPPIIYMVTPDIHGSIIPTEGEQSFILSAFHEPSGQVICGRETTIERVFGWMEGAKLVFEEAEGHA